MPVLHDLREYNDRLQIDGCEIGEDHDDDPVLIDREGRAVETWCEYHPYEERMHGRSTTRRRTSCRWSC